MCETKSSILSVPSSTIIHSILSFGYVWCSKHLIIIGIKGLLLNVGVHIVTSGNFGSLFFPILYFIY